jgi:hypothetical protein
VTLVAVRVAVKMGVREVAITEISHWLYAINPESEQWGYEISSFEVISDSEPHTWDINQGKTTSLTLGDQVWIYESRPVSAIVGKGTVASIPEFNGEKIIFEIKFDVALAKRLRNAPLKGMLSGSAPQSPRRLRADELARLGKQLGAFTLQKQTISAGIIKRLRQVSDRIGQSPFRQELLNLYGACCVTGTTVNQVLEAAHIRPYSQSPSNKLSNGLLLRADIHTLFDLGMIWIDQDYKVRIDPSLRGTEYAKYNGRKILNLPVNRSDRPDKNLLRLHRERTK